VSDEGLLVGCLDVASLLIGNVLKDCACLDEGAFPGGEGGIVE